MFPTDPPRHHRRALSAFDSALAGLEPSASCWTQPQRPGGWSPQDETAHVLRSCAYGLEVLAGGAAMPIERSPLVTATLRTVVLPVLLAAGVFPRGGRAPSLLAPDHPGTQPHRHPSATDARSALHEIADRVASAFAAAVGRGGPPVPHAYFGAMSPDLAWRVLSAHTVHHAKVLQSTGSNRASGPAAP